MKNAIIIIIIIFLIVGVFYFTTRQDIVFHHKIISSVPPDTLWEYFELVFTNSAKTNWPNHICILTSKSLDVNELITVNYRSPIKSKEVTYRIADLEKNKRITYKTTSDHPLDGGATIRLNPLSGGTEIEWTGAYSSKGVSLASIYFKYYFEKKFFPALKQSLSELEA